MIRVEAPARLHRGMLAVAGDGARQFGGLGVSVSRPAVVLEAQPADQLSAEGHDADRALMFAQRCHDDIGERVGRLSGNPERFDEWQTWLSQETLPQ